MRLDSNLLQRAVDTYRVAIRS